MNEDLKIDANSRWVLGAVTNDSNMYIRNARVNPISGALIVEANVTSSNTSIGSTIPGATQGSVFFAGLGGTLAQDNANFFWDDTSNYLGLGTNTPSETLHVVGTAIITGDVGTADQIVGRDSGTGEISGITVGSGLSLVGNTLTATGSGGSGYDTIENEGVAVTQRSTINLTNLLAASDVGGKTQLTIDVANLATDTTFIDDLIANSYFTTNLANDSTFISTLTGNSTFISDIVNIVNSSSSISINLATQVTGVLGVVNGGTGVSSVSQGDLLYGSATNTWSTLAKNTSATRYLSNTGTNNNPAWAQVDMSNGVTNTLAVGNGGTGATSHTAYAVICGGTTSTSPVQSVASVGTAGQVLTSNGAGALPTFQNATSGSSIVGSFVAGEAITAKDAVYLDSSIQFDAASTDVTAGSVTSQTFSHTVTTNANRFLVVGISVDTVPSGQVTGVTYNGIAMTLIRATGPGANPYTYLYGLIAPDTGTHNVVVSTNLAMKMVSYAASFYGVDQVTGIGADNGINNVGGPVIPWSVPITTSDQSVMIVDMGMSLLTGSLTPGTDQITIVDTNDSSNTFTAHGSYKKQKAIGATTMSWNQTSHNWAAGCVILLPFTGSVLYKTDASAADTSDGFIGFANAAITLGATGTVVLGGVVTGMSGLLIGTQYYLSDTPGQIDVTPGSTVRKVGIATATTELLITNIW